MESQTTYRLYEDRDAQQVADLLNRNHFSFGEIRPISAEEFRYIQKLRGMHFGVVGERDGKIIVLLTAHPSGGQKIRKKHQVYMDYFLIDADYRRHLYSLSEINRIALVYIVEQMPEITTMISEVHLNNRQSFLLQRQYGSFLFSEQGDLFDTRQLYNYGPGISRAINLEKCGEVIYKTTLLPLNKKQAMSADVLLEGRFGTRTAVLAGEQLEFLINVFSGYVFGVTRKESGLSLRVDTQCGLLRCRNAGQEAVRCVVDCLDADKKLLLRQELHVVPNSESDVAYPAATAYLDTDLLQTPFKFHFYALEDALTDLPEPVLSKIGDFCTFEATTGELRFSGAEERRFTELWPCVAPPYLYGGIFPDLLLNLSVTQSDAQTLSVTQEKEGYTLFREYRRDDSGLSIHTRVRMNRETVPDFRPIFHFFLNDLKGTCDFYAQDGRITHKEFDLARDYLLSYKEIVYYNYKPEPYSLRPLSEILLSFADSRYRITMDKPYTGFYYYNSVAIHPASAEAEKGGYDRQGDEIDLGILHIERLRGAYDKKSTDCQPG